MSVPPSAEPPRPTGSTPPSPWRPGAPPPPPWPVYPQSSEATLALVLGIVSVVGLPPVGPFAWWIGQREVRAVDAGLRDPSGRGAAQAGVGLGIAGTALTALLALLLVATVVGPFVVWLLLLLGLVLGAPVTESGADDTVPSAPAEEVDVRQEWIDAEPREGSSSEPGSAPDRCDLLDWFEDQLAMGLTTAEVRDAVGRPDSTDADGDAERWTWELGTCSFIDYDVYELVFDDGELVEWRYVQG